MLCEKFTQAQVIVSWDPTLKQIPLDLKKEIEKEWEKQTGFFNGQLARLDAWRFSDEKLDLFLRPTDYKTLLYSNRHTNDIVTNWGEECLSRALGISVVVTTQDQMLLLIKRSASVGEYPNYYDVFGGHIDCSQTENIPDVFVAMMKEIDEELALSRDLFSLIGIGLIIATVHKKPELLFWANVQLSSKDILKLANAAVDRYEYHNILKIKNDKSKIKEFLHQHKQMISPSAYGCLCIYLIQK